MSDIGRAVREQAKSVCWDMAITGYSLLQRRKVYAQSPTLQEDRSGSIPPYTSRFREGKFTWILHTDVPEVCHGMQYF